MAIGLNGVDRTEMVGLLRNHSFDLGALGCVQKADGKLVWSTNLVSDLGGGIPNGDIVNRF